MVTVPDSRLDELSKIINPQRVVQATVEFVDIAGLVREQQKERDLEISSYQILEQQQLFVKL